MCLFFPFWKIALSPPSLFCYRETEREIDREERRGDTEDSGGQEHPGELVYLSEDNSAGICVKSELFPKLDPRGPQVSRPNSTCDGQPAVGLV